jgi:hypothetical protein
MAVAKKNLNKLVAVAAVDCKLDHTLTKKSQIEAGVL